LKVARDEAISIAGPGADNNTLASINAQISAAVTKLTMAEHVVEEKRPTGESLGWFRRFFLLYKPATAKAWVSHLVCWFCLVVFLIVPFQMDWKKTLDTYYFFLFYIGIFLLFRQWGASQRRRYLLQRGAVASKEQVAAGIPKKRTFVVFPMVLALLYGLFGLGFVIAAFVHATTDTRAAVKFGAFGVLTVGCTVTFFVWGRLRSRNVPISKLNGLLLFLSPSILTLIIVFDIEGIVVKEFSNDPLGYWRNWGQQPVVPLIFIPMAALPLYAWFRCLKGASRNGLSSGPEYQIEKIRTD